MIKLYIELKSGNRLWFNLRQLRQWIKVVSASRHPLVKDKVNGIGIKWEKMADKSPAEIKALLESQGMRPDRHNWLYSFMSVANRIYLVAYDKQCDQTVSVQVPIGNDGAVMLSRAGVPKLGCDWNGE